MQIRLLLQSAIEKCLSSVVDKHSAWIDFLIKSLIERLQAFFILFHLVNLLIHFKYVEILGWVIIRLV